MIIDSTLNLTENKPLATAQAKERAIKLLVFLTILVLAFGRESPIVITPNVPLTLRLDGVAPSILSYDAPNAETISITVRALDPIDPVLEILTPNDHRLAYNDDSLGQVDGLSFSDAAVTRLALPAAGRYQIRVNSFNGVSVGQVEVILTTPSAFDVTESDDARLIQLPPDHPVRYLVDAQSGDQITFTAYAPGLDPIVRLYDLNGTMIAVNDDHGSTDTTLNTLDARLTVTIPASGQYTLEVADFLGRAGPIRLTESR
ncbi:MAG: hypothetical protein MUF87_01130 [Anaerolineae bacterium]|jgi:hypothetical protein|nr:hypothetical protein [Anaerolineae bacterium]